MSAAKRCRDKLYSSDYSLNMKNLKGLSLTLLLMPAFLLPLSVAAQVGVGSSVDYDIDYLTPRQYEIGGIEFEGAENFDNRMVLLIAGLQVGDKISIPGDHISTAIDNLWKQGMFEDVRIAVTRMQGNIAFLKIVLRERPKLSKFRFYGVSNSDAKKLREDMHVTTGDVVTENMLQTSANIIRTHYMEKGFSNVDIATTMEPDTTGGHKDRVIVNYKVKRGKRVKIDSLIISGNTTISTNKLLRKMKNTHDVHYGRKLFVWTKGFWTRSKYREEQFNEDMDNIIRYYNEQGYRDARVIFDTVFQVPDDPLKAASKKQDRLKVIMNIHEGSKYYFRNITFAGNTVYTDDQLAKSLRIDKGMPYNRTQLETNINYNPSGTDLTSLYMDNGYLFFNCTPVEVAVENDSIDIEVRIVEGKQARIRNVSVEGNTVTDDRVIYRELRTRPGDLFSRDAILRSRRELVALQYFKEETLIPTPKPNAADGTVDIVYNVEEGHTDQVSLQGGYGSRTFILQAGLQLNNFSVRKMFDKNAWTPIPRGDGQKLALNVGLNYYYRGASFSFTEPWLGGRRPQNLTMAVYVNNQSNTMWVKKDASSYWSLTTYGGTIGLTRHLKWPDDYFILSQSINYKHYNVDDTTGSAFRLAFNKGHSNDINYSIALSRNSYDSPIYTRSGSELAISATATLPYSLLTGKDFSTATPAEKYRWLEYYKINLRGSWNYNIIGDIVLNAKFRFGFMGSYNKDIGLSPFGRYYLGGDGLGSYYYDGREVIAQRGYGNFKLSPETGAGVFDRFTLELRQPIIESNASTIWVLGFLEGGNSWTELKDFQPFQTYNSAGVGVRLYMPMFGLIGVDWGYGFDGAYGGGQFHFSINGSLD